MLLCDSLNWVSANRNNFRKLHLTEKAFRLPAVAMQLDAVSVLSENSRGASRHVLQDDVIDAATRVLLLKPASLRDCMTALRIPWPVAMFEWRDRSRVQARMDAGVIRDNGQPVPARFGFLVESTPDGRRGTVRFAWQHEKPPGGGDVIPDTSPIFCRFDFDRVGDAAPDTPEAMPEHLRQESDLFRRWAKSPADIAALQDLNRAIWVDGVSDAKRFALAVAASSGGLISHLTAYHHLLGDIAGEGIFFLAVVILLTARNATETREEDRSKLNRARARRGEVPLCEHVSVSMKLGQPRRESSVRPESTGVSGRSPPRKHPVIGHPFARSGVICWQPGHSRGLNSGRPAAETRTVSVTL